MVTRTELHRLIDALPDEALPEAGRLLDGIGHSSSCRQHESSETSVTNGAGESQGPDALAVALANAQHLGEEFSSRHPHRLAGRGDRWSPSA